MKLCSGILATLFMTLFLVMAGSGSALAASKGKVKEIFEPGTPVCKVADGYVQDCTEDDKLSGTLVVVVGRLPNNMPENSVVLIRGAEAGKGSATVVACGDKDALMDIIDDAAEEEVKDRELILWLEKDGNRAVLLLLDKDMKFSPDEKVKLKAKRRAPVVEGC